MYPPNALSSLLAGNPDVRYLVLIRQIWHRSRASIVQRVRVAPFISQEIVEKIIAHLIYDKHSLMACSLTCRSWYIASVPHLHHTLVMTDATGGRYAWPKPLQKTSKYGLLPLVKKLQLRRSLTDACGVGFRPVIYNHDILRQISGLTNIRELEIEYLEIPVFLPKIQKYYGHFLPRLQSLNLREPKGSNRQVIFFIGLFQRLEDLTLLGGQYNYWGTQPFNNPKLIPSSTPPLRGRLVMLDFRRPHFLEEMIELFGRIRFRYMALCRSGKPQLLLNACAGTLETVRLCSFNVCGERSRSEHMGLLANKFTGCSSHFNLSKNKSLQTLEITASCLVSFPEYRLSMPAILTFLKTVLSTIKSPTFSEVFVSHWGYDWSTDCIAFYPYRKPNY